MDLKEKNIIVTGGSLGIGRATAIELKKRGANVLVTGRSLVRLSESFKDGKIKLCDFDIGELNKISLNARKCLEMLDNRVDVLVNNAGIGVSKSVEDITADDFLDVYNVNVFGLALFTKEIVPLMKKQKRGTIINIGSTASLKGYKNGSIYSSSKFAVRSLSQCWQSELRPYNIRVCQINPSEVTTAFGSANRLEREEKPNRLSPKEISHAIISAIEMDNKGFINELNVWATNPFEN
tara:strand:- start:1198 stop:1908 length:711 start_codon:yes stop_codon:yes gene_type:complete